MTSENGTEDGAVDGPEPSLAAVNQPGIDREKAAEGARLLLEAVGVDPDDETIIETWSDRVPRALETLTEGTRERAKPTMRTFEIDNESLVIKTGIPIYSLCEHHLLPYFGRAHVAYRPDGRAVGLSKLTRYVRWQSRRLSIQEQLTQDIAEGLALELEAGIVMVEISATHLCEAMRGIETASETTSRATVGDATSTETTRFQKAIVVSEQEPKQ